jgi:hypothetical protein
MKLVAFGRHNLYSWNSVNVTTSNQSLILAGEPPLGRVGRLVASGTALKRVTVLAARPAVPAVSTNSGAARRPASTSFHRDPLQLYARTQRSLDEMPTAPLIDVFA